MVAMVVIVGTGGLIVGGSDGRSDYRYGRSGVESGGNGFAGERTKRAIIVERKVILECSVRSGRKTKGLDQEVVSRSIFPGELTESSHDVNQFEINMDEKLVVEKQRKS